MEDLKLQTDVDTKYFRKQATIKKKIKDGHYGNRYIYKISHEDQSYILKGFKIHLEHWNPSDKKSIDRFRETIEQINEVYQEYCFAKVACVFNPHFVKPLFLDYKIKAATGRGEYSYLYIEVIFEDGGVSLNNLKSVNIDEAYNLMRQSANALVLLHDIGIAHFDIKPDNMVYEKKNDILKIIDMGSAFGSSTREKVTKTTVSLNGKVRSATLDFAPPEVLRIEKKPEEVAGIEVTMGSVDVYCWAMCFYSMIRRKSVDDLKNDRERYKRGSEIDYGGYVENVKEDLDSIRNSTEYDKINKIDFIKHLLTNSLMYKPKDRPTMRRILNDMKEFENTHNIKINHTDITFAFRLEPFNQGQNKEETKATIPQNNKELVKYDHSGTGRKEVYEMPVHEDSDLVSPKVKEIEKKLGSFKFEEPLDESLEMGNTIRLADESLYTGQWNKKGHKHGRGICTYSDGSKYEGYHKNDEKNGKGRLIYNNGDVYEGNWVNDKCEGYGIHTYSYGSQYKGEWKNDLKHGKGISTLANGDKYDGEWKNNLKDGKGISTLANGDKYDGEWKNNEKHGRGVHALANGDKYDGEWKNSENHGRGVNTLTNGNRYDGEWKNSEKHGKGVYTWADGEKYDGRWKNNEMHG